MTFLYPNVVKCVSELLVIVPWDECKYCFLRGKNNKKGNHKLYSILVFLLLLHLETDYALLILPPFPVDSFKILSW